MRSLEESGDVVNLMYKFSDITFVCSNQGDFRSFVGAIRAGGGRDAAEDIMGGLNKTFSCLSWREEASKVWDSI